MRRSILVILTIALLATPPSAGDCGRPAKGERLAATLDRIIDGDTVAVRLRSSACGVVIRRLRLADGLDCPEKRQPWGLAATLRTAELLSGEFIVEYSGKSTYDRAVARIWLPDGRRLAEVLCREGLAWTDPRYAKGPWGKRLTRAMEAARKAKLGLWADPDPIPPRQWRKGRRK